MEEIYYVFAKALEYTASTIAVTAGVYYVSYAITDLMRDARGEKR